MSRVCGATYVRPNPRNQSKCGPGSNISPTGNKFRCLDRNRGCLIVFYHVITPDISSRDRQRAAVRGRNIFRGKVHKLLHQKQLPPKLSKPWNLKLPTLFKLNDRRRRNGAKCGAAMWAGWCNTTTTGWRSGSLATWAGSMRSLAARVEINLPSSCSSNLSTSLSPLLLRL